MNDLMHVIGVEKDFCWLTNWLNMNEEFTLEKNHLNATSAINVLLIQVHYLIIVLNVMPAVSKICFFF